MRNLILYVLGCLLLSAPAVACSCGDMSACSLASKATAVFVGTAAEVNGDNVQFNVHERFRGDLGSAVDVVAPQSDPMGCGVAHFRQGERYLVFAFAEQDGRLWVGGCNPSRPVAVAQRDIEFLRKRVSSPDSTYVYGTAVRVQDANPPVVPLAGILVTLTGPVVRQARSGPSGAFEFVGLQPGDYEVSIAFPDELRPFPKRTVTVKPSACVAVPAVTTWGGEISGIVLDPLGRPMPNHQMSLINLDKPRGEGLAGHTEDDGRFTFDGLSPGRYTLSFADSEEASPEFPYAPTFFPGVPSLSEARVLTLSEGTKLRVLEFRLPNYTPRRLGIEVRRSDGRLVPGAQVYVEYEQAFIYRSEWTPDPWITDTGVGAIPVYGEGKVVIYASSPERFNPNEWSEAVTVELANLSGTPLRLVLARGKRP